MIYDIIPVNNYTGNSSNKRFDFNFYIENISQLRVSLFDENNIKTTLVHGLDYTINEVKNANGSYITFPIESSSYSVLNENQKLSLELTLPISQETQYNNSSLLNLTALEYSFDYLTRLIQILARKLDLCVRIEECSAHTPNELMEQFNDQVKLVNNQALITDENLTKINNIYGKIIELNNSIQEAANLNNEKLLKIDAFEQDLADGLDTINTVKTQKANIDLNNCTRPYVIEAQQEDFSGYRLWSDKFLEQWGWVETKDNVWSTVTLIKPYRDTFYNIALSPSPLPTFNGVMCAYSTSRTPESFKARVNNYEATACYWSCRGYME